MQTAMKKKCTIQSCSNELGQMCDETLAYCYHCVYNRSYYSRPIAQERTDTTPYILLASIDRVHLIPA